MLVTISNAARQRLDGVALISLRFVRTYKSEFHNRLAQPRDQLNSLGSLTEVNFGEWASLHYTTREKREDGMETRRFTVSSLVPGERAGVSRIK